MGNSSDSPGGEEGYCPSFENITCMCWGQTTERLHKAPDGPGLMFIDEESNEWSGRVKGKRDGLREGRIISSHLQGLVETFNLPIFTLPDTRRREKCTSEISYHLQLISSARIILWRPHMNSDRLMSTVVTSWNHFYRGVLDRRHADVHLVATNVQMKVHSSSFLIRSSCGHTQWQSEPIHLDVSSGKH